MLRCRILHEIKLPRSKGRNRECHHKSGSGEKFHFHWLPPCSGRSFQSARTSLIPAQGPSQRHCNVERFCETRLGNYSMFKPGITVTVHLTAVPRAEPQCL